MKIEYVDLTSEDFENSLHRFRDRLHDLFTESHRLEQEIIDNLGTLTFER